MDKKSAQNLKYPVQTLEKALEIIELLSKDSSGNGLGISELSRELDIGKSTVHRVLSTLMAYGYVDKMPNNSNYRLSWRLYELGSVVPLQRDLGKIDTEILQDICNRYGETVNLGVRSDNYVVIIAKVEPQIVLRTNIQIGAREPLHATALGKVLISELSQEELKEVISVGDGEFKDYTPNTISGWDDLMLELQKVREQGYAIDDQEFCLGISCIAMPVRNYNNDIVAAISVTGPSVRINFNKIMDIKEGLAWASKKLSGYLGFKNVIG